MTLHVREFAGSPSPLAGPKSDNDEMPRPGLLARLGAVWNLFKEAHRRHRIMLAERQASLVIRLNGGVLTDELERRIAKLMMGL